MFLSVCTDPNLIKCLHFRMTKNSIIDNKCKVDHISMVCILLNKQLLDTFA